MERVQVSLPVQLPYDVFIVNPKNRLIESRVTLMPQDHAVLANECLSTLLNLNPPDSEAVTPPVSTTDNIKTRYVYGFVTTGDVLRALSYNGKNFRITRQFHLLFEAARTVKEQWL